jgi:hypothetical protein
VKEHHLLFILFQSEALLPYFAALRRTLVYEVWGDVDWIGLAQDRDRWRALVNSVMNLRVP